VTVAAIAAVIGCGMVLGLGTPFVIRFVGVEGPICIRSCDDMGRCGTKQRDYSDDTVRKSSSPRLHDENACAPLRLSYSPRADEQPLPGLDAADEIAVSTPATRRRAYLAMQNINLAASLHAPSRRANFIRTFAAQHMISRVTTASANEDALFPVAPQESWRVDGDAFGRAQLRRS
jgi:hypothetical protein